MKIIRRILVKYEHDVIFIFFLLADVNINTQYDVVLLYFVVVEDEGANYIINSTSLYRQSFIECSFFFQNMTEQ